MVGKDQLIRNLGVQMMNRFGENLSNEGLAIINALYDEFAPKRIPLKVKRSEDAKQFPLIHIKKDGDVGFDLTAVMPYKSEWELENVRNLYLDSLESPDIEYIEREVFREQMIAQPHDKVTVPTGIFIECPHGWWASIEARSSTSAARMMVPKGVIDEGYRGELFAVLINIGDEPRVIKHGERYIQLIVHERNSKHIDVVEVDELSDSERGDTGFGSTGKSEERALAEA